METIESYLQSITALDEQAMAAAQQRLDSLTKPPGSLGRLEEAARQLAGIFGEVPKGSRSSPIASGIAQFPKDHTREAASADDRDECLPGSRGDERSPGASSGPFGAKAVIVMAGDHGVCEEGISAFPQEVTGQMVKNFLDGGAAVNVLARHVGADVVCVDMGIRGEYSHPRLINRKIREGPGNIAVGPAMTRAEAEQAVLAGCRLVSGLADQGCRLFATGEMGIGNTTPSAALLAVLAGADIARAAGRGTGIDDATWLHKQQVIRRAIEINQPDADDPLDVLAKLGGFEIAGLVGVILGAAARRCPVVIDGFISSAAALVASRMAPLATGYMLASHLSKEQGHGLLLEAVGLSPVLHMDMRLGEGTGALLAFPLLEAAVKVLGEMATFDSAGISKA